MAEVARELLSVSLEEEMQQSYLDYAMSVIVGRALPDARDGLKPVHRRVLFAMRELGNDYNKAYKKSARVVGDVIGKYHPHGDSAVYRSTCCRTMSEPFYAGRTIMLWPKAMGVEGSWWSMQTRSSRLSKRRAAWLPRAARCSSTS